MEIFSIDSLSGRIYAKNEINFSKDSIIEFMVLVTYNSVNFLSDSALITINILSNCNLLILLRIDNKIAK